MSEAFLNRPKRPILYYRETQNHTDIPFWMWCGVFSLYTVVRAIECKKIVITKHHVKVMFALIGNIIVCILWGAFLSSVFVALLYAVVRVLWHAIPFSLLTFFIALTTWILIFFQSTVLVGAMHAKEYVDDIAVLATKLMEQMNTPCQAFSPNDVEQFKQKLTEEYPLLSSYINKVETAAFTSGSIDLVKEVKNQINCYILRRVLWIGGFMIIGGFLLGWSRPQYRQMPVDWNTI